MRVIWAEKAGNSYIQTLDYWDIHNGSCSYSDKITIEVDSLIEDISKNPYFLAKYIAIV